jgi:hypothetical protein
MRTLLLGLIAVLGVSSPVTAADTVTACDTLASHPEDPDRIAPGVEDIKDKDAAIAACEADVKKDPNNRRLRYQLARVLFYSQRTADSIPHLEFAANAGSQQAQFVYGYIIDEALQGVKRDACKVEDLWFKSANQGRFAALVSYPHHVMNNKFAGCKVQATPAQIDAYLAKAKGAADGYYQTLLAQTLTEDYARFKGAQ